MQQFYEVIVQSRFRAFCEAPDHAGQNPLGNLADDDKDDRDEQRLQIPVWADNFGPLLNALDGLAQDL